MRITNNEKLKMVIEHINEGKSLSHVCEQHDYKDTSKLKYWVNLYKLHGEKAFINRENGIYRRDTKLLAIGRVENGESIRSVSVDIGLIEPGILSDLYISNDLHDIADDTSKEEEINEYLYNKSYEYDDKDIDI